MISLSVCLSVTLAVCVRVFMNISAKFENRFDSDFLVNSSRLCLGQRLEYWAPVPEFAPHSALRWATDRPSWRRIVETAALRACHQMMMMSCEEQIRVQALNLLRLLWIVQSTVCPCLFTEICTCCFLFAVIQTLHLIVIVLIFNRGPSGHLHYITCRSYPSKTGKYMPFKKIAKQHAGNKAIALCFPIWLVVL